MTKGRVDGRIVLVALTGGLVLQGCDGDSDGPGQTATTTTTATFEVTTVNTTNAQPLSPVAVVAHDGSYRVFSVGDPASDGLEVLAEDGDAAPLIDEADATTGVISTASGTGPIGPAGSESVTVTVPASELPGLTLSQATMLVNTNDAFAAVNGLAIGDLAAGESVTVDAIAYDAGTEADTESAAEIPGPAGGGEGFNAARDDDADRVTMHSGVVGQDDGFATSDLDNQHRFDNPVMRVRVTRID